MIAFLACNINNGKVVDKSYYTNKEISRNLEKIVLLSKIQEIETVETVQVLKIYLNSVRDKKNKINSIEKYLNLIKSISNKTNLNTKKISSLLFMYKYEMKLPSKYISKTKSNLKQWVFKVINLTLLILSY